MNCSCWKCWLQANSTILILLICFVVSFTVTLVIMHEQKIPDEYAKWGQEFTAGIFAAMTLAMNISPKATPHQGDSHEPPAKTTETKGNE